MLDFPTIMRKNRTFKQGFFSVPCVLFFLFNSSSSVQVFFVSPVDFSCLKVRFFCMMFLRGRELTRPFNLTNILTRELNMTYILHCGGREATERDLMAVQVPEATRSYHPVSYMDLVSEVREQSDKRLPYPCIKEQFGLNKTGNQMFALFTYDTGNPDHSLLQGLRQSLDKKFPVGLATGDRVMVCDNLILSGSSYRQMRKNTKHVWRDYVDMVSNSLELAPRYHDKILSDYEDMRSLNCSEDRGAEVIGRAHYEGILKANQASVAWEDWRKPRHEAFSNRDWYSLFNCFTEGLKKGTPGEAVKSLTRAHGWFNQNLGLERQGEEVAQWEAQNN